MDRFNLHPNQIEAITNISETLDMSFSEVIGKLLDDNCFTHQVIDTEASIDGSLTVLNNINSNLSQIESVANNYIIQESVLSNRAKLNLDDIEAVREAVNGDTDISRLDKDANAFRIGKALLLDSLKQVEQILNIEFDYNRVYESCEVPQFYIDEISRFEMIPSDSKRTEKKCSSIDSDRLKEIKEKHFYFKKVREFEQSLNDFIAVSEPIIRDNLFKNYKTNVVAKSLNNLSNVFSSFDIYEDVFLLELMKETTFETFNVNYSDEAIALHNKVRQLLSSVNEKVKKYHQNKNGNDDIETDQAIKLVSNLYQADNLILKLINNYKSNCEFYKKLEISNKEKEI
ncbi:hypothetical protein KW496_19555 [Vibrio fluvialis]|nr:hypothetical protein [Vibrio fluvialis]